MFRGMWNVNPLLIPSISYLRFVRYVNPFLKHNYTTLYEQRE